MTSFYLLHIDCLLILHVFMGLRIRSRVWFITATRTPLSRTKIYYLIEDVIYIITIATHQYFTFLNVSCSFPASHMK
ncbi:uncharacterized protein BT62DRAFT_175184 [Guyanagaster necrorhizus]|uniref:Uncharacterized protein n=1 Tax=Guyanagaster necrorhizus TaxID=856835 RepID=A0A9P7VTM9_9AGAR|nr:uncharacterized protein BT62DRAFT_175184 [Guyanagaster necrorhizus MCA 3950]KAG7445721.1 hypothetical protein BT62DRAFT_175184 [Guyanagaster necrorhizus MCA 3950]